MAGTWFVNTTRVKQTLSAGALAGDIIRIDQLADGTINEVLAYPAGYVLTSGEATAANTLQSGAAAPAPPETTSGERTARGTSIKAVTQAYAATVTPNCDQADVLNVGALTGAITIAAPVGSPSDGQRLRIRLVQDATGGRVITWNAAYAFGTTFTAASIATTTNAKATAEFEWTAPDSKWRCVKTAVGF